MEESKTVRRIRGAAPLHGHCVICNWNELGDQIVREMHASIVRQKCPIIIVTDRLDDIPTDTVVADGYDPYDQVMLVPGDPTSEHVLARAGVANADCVIVLADPREGQYADAKSVLIALACEAIEPEVHTIVQILQSRNLIHFTHTTVDEIVCVEEITEKLLAQTALTHGLSQFYTRLLTATEDTNEVYIVDVPEHFIGKTYAEVERLVFEDVEQTMILVGMQTRAERANGKTRADGAVIHEKVMSVNPPTAARLTHRPDLRKRGIHSRDHVLEPTDQLIVIAYHCPDFSAIES